VSEGGDRSRVERARAGDPEAHAELFRSYQPAVRRLCRRILGDDAAAEDATSEAFLRVQKALGGYDASRPFRPWLLSVAARPWLLSVAANHCIDVLRRRATEKRLFEEHDFATADLRDSGPSPLHQAMRAQERARILSAIDALPVKFRLPLVLRHFAELEYEAIAGLLGISRNQVGTLLLRARRRLRANLGGRRE
jgi:RNA polymerase sigma-70 factor (ECF subfamily)